MCLRNLLNALDIFIITQQTSQRGRMQEALKSKGKVLIHCSQGVSRSTTLLIAFLMWRSNQAYDETFQQVKAMRGVANPNIGFICQVH